MGIQHRWPTVLSGKAWAIHVDDLVVRAQSVGVVVACFELESDLLLDVEVMQHVESWKGELTK